MIVTESIFIFKEDFYIITPLILELTVMQCIREFYFHLILRGCIIRIVIMEMLCYRTYNSNDSRKLGISSFRFLLAPGPCFQCCDCEEETVDVRRSTERQ